MTYKNTHVYFTSLYITDIQLVLQSYNQLRQIFSNILSSSESTRQNLVEIIPIWYRASVLLTVVIFFFTPCCCAGYLDNAEMHSVCQIQGKIIRSLHRTQFRSREQSLLKAEQYCDQGLMKC